MEVLEMLALLEHIAVVVERPAVQIVQLERITLLQHHQDALVVQLVIHQHQEVLAAIFAQVVIIKKALLV